MNASCLGAAPKVRRGNPGKVLLATLLTTHTLIPISPKVNAVIPPNFDDIGLLVIDMQEKLLPAMPPEIGERTIRNIDILTELVADCGGTVVYTEQNPRGLGPTVESLRTRLADAHAQRIEKVSFSCLQDPRFVEDILDRLPLDLIIVGVEAHICVLQTVLDLLQPDEDADEEEEPRHIYIPLDATCSRSKQNWRNAVDQMYDAGAFITNTETLVFQALGESTHERFKHYSKRIR